MNPAAANDQQLRFHSSPHRKPLSTRRTTVAEILATLRIMGHAHRGITKER